MKKMKRILAVVLSVVLCLSLCGCRELDEMKANHATWMENGNIQWNGHTYIPLYSTDEMVYYEYVEDLNWDDSEVIHVTNPDVPVLLSSTLGTNGYTGADGLLLEVNRYAMPPSISVNDTLEYAYKNYVYCRSDVYNWTVEALQSGYDIQEYGYYFYDYDNGEEKRGTLTDAQRQAIEDVINNVTPITVPAEESYYYDYERSLTLSAYSMAHLFSQDMGELYYNNNGAYSLVVSYYDDVYNRYEQFYDVPEKYTALFNDLFDKIGVPRNMHFSTASTTLGEMA